MIGGRVHGAGVTDTRAVADSFTGVPDYETPDATSAAEMRVIAGAVLADPGAMLAVGARGLATALAETAWYAFATGASAWLIFQANADIVVYQDWTALRPGHWVALVGLGLAVLHLFRKPAPRPEGMRRPARA